jgi:hypothetical protein
MSMWSCYKMFRATDTEMHIFHRGPTLVLTISYSCVVQLFQDKYEVMSEEKILIVRDFMLINVML